MEMINHKVHQQVQPHSLPPFFPYGNLPPAKIITYFDKLFHYHILFVHVHKRLLKMFFFKTFIINVKTFKIKMVVHYFKMVTTHESRLSGTQGTRTTVWIFAIIWYYYFNLFAIIWAAG